MTDCFAMLRPESRKQLLANHVEQMPLKGTRKEIDYLPVCKLFTPWLSMTWLLTECDEDGLAFGLADLGMGTPEMGYISLDELWEITGPGGLKIEEDIHWKPKRKLSEYAADARAVGYIRY